MFPREAPSIETHRVTDWSAIMTRDEKARVSKTTCFSWSCALIISLLAGEVSLVQAALENPRVSRGHGGSPDNPKRENGPRSNSVSWITR